MLRQPGGLSTAVVVRGLQHQVGLVRVRQVKGVDGDRRRVDAGDVFHFHGGLRDHFDQLVAHGGRIRGGIGNLVGVDAQLVDVSGCPLEALDLAVEGLPLPVGGIADLVALLHPDASAGHLFGAHENRHLDGFNRHFGGSAVLEAHFTGTLRQHKDQFALAHPESDLGEIPQELGFQRLFGADLHGHRERLEGDLVALGGVVAAAGFAVGGVGESAVIEKRDGVLFRGRHNRLGGRHGFDQFHPLPGDIGDLTQRNVLRGIRGFGGGLGGDFFRGG